MRARRCMREPNRIRFTKRRSRGRDNCRYQDTDSAARAKVLYAGRRISGQRAAQHRFYRIPYSIGRLEGSRPSGNTFPISASSAALSVNALAAALSAAWAAEDAFGTEKTVG